MSDKCGNCDCFDKSQCAKKGNTYAAEIVETHTRYEESSLMEVGVGEHDGKCKCGTSCACVDCTCGH